MSSKVSILLTSDNEHWYKEGEGPYYEQSKTQNPIVLEIDKSHMIETTENQIRVIIEEGTPLYEEISLLLNQKKR